MMRGHVFDLPGRGLWGFNPPLDEDDFPTGGRKFWSGGRNGEIGNFVMVKN